MLNVDFYRPIVEFLALYMGSNTEVILCDTKNILLIENSMDEERFEGAPIGEMQQALIQNPECRDIPYNINYRTLSKTGEKVRSATLFIRDAEGTLEGLLTINQGVGELVRLRNMLDMLISGIDSVLNSLKDVADSIIGKIRDGISAAAFIEMRYIWNNLQVKSGSWATTSTPISSSRPNIWPSRQ